MNIWQKIELIRRAEALQILQKQDDERWSTFAGRIREAQAEANRRETERAAAAIREFGEEPTRARVHAHVMAELWASIARLQMLGSGRR